MNKVTSIIISAVVISIGIITIGWSGVATTENTAHLQNIEIRDGIQYIKIDVKGGYSPSISSAKANIPTKLILKTDGTYDCSASLVIKSLNYKKILSQTGEEVVDIGTPVAGVPLTGVCGMGMYSFLINFS